MEKEVVLDGCIYVKVRQVNSEKSDEVLIEEAKEKVQKVLEEAGLDCQIFKEDVREV